MPATITRRPMTDEERRRFRTTLRGTIGCLVFATVAAALPALGGGEFGTWIGGLIGGSSSGRGAAIGGWIGLGIGAAGGLLLLGVTIAMLRFQGSINRLAVEAGEVEIVHVTDAQWVDLDTADDSGPLLACAIDDVRMLVLWGQWLMDHEIYGLARRTTPRAEVDRAIDAGAVNGRVGAEGFPNDAVRILREPLSGTVLRIELLGTLRAPQRTGELEPGATGALGMSGESIILETTPDELEAAIVRMGAGEGERR